MWYNHRFRGAALTVEYGADPKRRRPARSPRRARCCRSSAPATAPRVRPRRAVAAQRPSKTGFSFATNAATAAGWSAVAPVRCIIALSNSSASSNEWPAAYATDLPHRAQRDGRSGGEPAGQRRDLVGQLVGRHHLGGQPEGRAPPRRGSCWGSRAAPSPWRGPTSRWQVVAGAGVAGERDVGEGEVEAGRVGEDPQVAGERQAGARTGGDAVDRRDDRLGHRRQRGDDRVVVLVDGGEQLRRCRRTRSSWTCSLRSCPTQNARPVPVSTTQRAAGSSATLRTVSSSASLVATSRLFMASGRLSVMVATPSVRSSSTGDRTWPAVCQTVVTRRQSRQRATNRSAPGFSRVASLVEQLGGGAARPVRRAAARSGRPGSANRNLRHSWTRWKRAGERRLVVVAVLLEVPGEQAVGVGQPAVVRRPRARRGPRPRVGAGSTVDARGRCARSRRPARAPSRARRARTGSPTRCRRARRTRGTRGRRAAGRGRSGSVGGSTNARCQAPSHCGSVPSGRSGRRPRRAAGWRARWRGSRGRRSSGDRLEPALHHHPRDRGPHRRRGDADGREQAHQRGHRRLAAPAAQVVAVEVEEGRPGVHARESASPVALAGVTRPIGDNGSARVGAVCTPLSVLNQEEVRGWRR